MNPPLPILILPLDTPADIVAEARAVGYLPVLTDKPEGVRIAMREESADRHAMLMAGMHAISDTDSRTERSRFFHELHRRIKASE